ncbi:protein of unknown function DUF1822 [Halothece sp. PCC 7418]|uniref:DUF1822 family protein n=1 Tax=Halothece sp. (strain PCC 7418) TaxID=65093 RepID=UPI0002A06CA0|nr:DUF1822 family protein [Halothece sp. PCC 7418]AFZ42273.1 protein of unknown function DUF1822 [Halothece sp. PCC 7418]
MTQNLTAISTPLIDLNPDHLWIEFSPSEIQPIEQPMQSHPLAQKNSFLNQISSQKIQQWLEEELGKKLSPRLSFPEKDLPSIWEFVNGTSITIGNQRLVIIPTEGTDLEALEVPQEWVDIAGWEADYYLAVQVETEANWLRVWGYTTYQQLKARGYYNAISKTYEIERQDLIEEINVMLFAQEWNCRESSPQISPPEVSEEKVQSLIQKHGKQPGYSLRMLMPFPEWAYFLSHGVWRKQIYQHRLRGVTETSPLQQVWQKTGSWLADQSKQGWHSVESVLGSRQSLSYQVRNHQSFPEDAAAKIIDLGIELKQSAFALLVAQVPTENQKVLVYVQVHPVGENAHLPPNLQLELLDETGKLVQKPVIARHYDHLIQLKRFKAPRGTPFQIKLSLDEANVTERFRL